MQIIKTKYLPINFFVAIALFVFSFSASAQRKLEVEYLYKKDSAFKEVVYEYWGSDPNVTMVVKVASEYGHFIWIFEKERKEEIRNEGTSDVLSVKYHNLYANILLEDHGGTLGVAKFQDFGNEVYAPEFQYPYCQVDDADHDGMPEFYLTYFGFGDGLDAKPLKVIVYTSSHSNRKLEKSKATAWYPGGNEGETYHVDYDPNWGKLPRAIQLRGKKILSDIKNKKIVGE